MWARRGRSSGHVARAVLLSLATAGSAADVDSDGSPINQWEELNQTIKWPSFATGLTEESKRCLMEHTRRLHLWRAAPGTTEVAWMRLRRDTTLYELYWLFGKAMRGLSNSRVTLELEDMEGPGHICTFADSNLTRIPRSPGLRSAIGPTETRIIVQFHDPEVIWPYCAHDVDPRQVHCPKSIHMDISRQRQYIEYIKQFREWGTQWPRSPCTRQDPCGLVVTMNGPLQRTANLNHFYCGNHPEFWLIDSPLGGRFPAWYFELWPFSWACYTQQRNVIMYFAQREFEWGHLPSDTSEDFIMPTVRQFVQDNRHILNLNRIYVTGWDTGGFAAYDLGVAFGQDIFSHVVIAAPQALQIAKRWVSSATPIDLKKRKLRRVTFGVGTNDVVTGTSDPTTLQSILAVVHNNQLLEGVDAEILVYPMERHYIHTHLHNKFAAWLWRGEDPFNDPPPPACEGEGHCRPWEEDRSAVGLACLLLLCAALFWAQEERLRALCPQEAARREEAVPTDLHWWNPELQAWLTRPSTEAGWEGYEGGSGALLLRDAQNSEALARWSPWSAVREHPGPPYSQRLFEGGLTNAAFNEVDRHVLAGHGEEAAYASLGEHGRVATTTRRELLLQSAAAALALHGAGGLRSGGVVLLALPPGARQAAWVEACKRSGLVYSCCGPGLAAMVLAGRVVDLGAAVALAADAAPWRDGLREALSAHAALREICEALEGLGVADLRAVRALSPDGLAVPLAAVLERPEVAALPGDARKQLAASCRLDAKVKLSLLDPEPAPQRASAAAADGVGGAFGAAYRKLVQVTSKCRNPTELVSEVWRFAGAPRPVEANSPLFIAYGPASAGRPQRIVHCHGAHLSSTAETMRTTFKATPGKGAMLAAADAGGVNAQSYQITGPLCCRLTALVVQQPPSASGSPASLPEVLRSARLLDAGSTVRRCMVADAATGGKGAVYTLHCGSGEAVDVDGAPVSAEKVEEVLMRGAPLCPAIAKCVVVGVPHRLHGEVPVACVVRSDPGAQVPQSEQDHLRGLVLEELGAFPMALVVVDGVPETLGGKAVRGFIREIAMGRPLQAVSGLRNRETLAELQKALKDWEAHVQVPTRGGPGGARAAGPTPPADAPGAGPRAPPWEPAMHSVYGIALCMTALRQWLPPDNVDGTLVAPARPLLLALQTSSFQLNALFVLGGLETRLEDGAAAGRREAAAALLYVGTALPHLAGFEPGKGPPHRWLLVWLILARGIVASLLHTGVPALLQIGGLFAAALALHESPDARLDAPGVRGLLWDLPDFGSIGHKVYWVAMYVAGYHWGPLVFRFLDRWMAPCSRIMRLCISVYAVALFAWVTSLAVEESPPGHGSAHGFEDLSHVFGSKRVYALRVSLALMQLAAAFMVCRSGVPGLRQMGSCALTTYALQPYLQPGISCVASGRMVCSLRRRGIVGGGLQLLLLLPFPAAYGLCVGAAWHLLGGLLGLAAHLCPQQQLLRFLARRWEPMRAQAESAARDLSRDVLRRVDEARSTVPLPAKLSSWLRGSDYGPLSAEEGDGEEGEGAVEHAEVYGQPAEVHANGLSPQALE